MLFRFCRHYWNVHKWNRNYGLTKQNHFKNETNCGKLEIFKITCKSIKKCISKVFRVRFTFLVRISTSVSSQDYCFMPWSYRNRSWKTYMKSPAFMCSAWFVNMLVAVQQASPCFFPLLTVILGGDFAPKYKYSCTTVLPELPLETILHWIAEELPTISQLWQEHCAKVLSFSCDLPSALSVHDLEGGIPSHTRWVGNWWGVRSLLTQAFHWFYDFYDSYLFVL